MLLRVCSDLHLESKIQPQDIISAQLSGDYDVLVLAGDIFSYRNANDYLELIRDKASKPIVWVLGNHEFYGTRKSLEDSVEEFKGMAKAHDIYLLENDTVEIQGKKFFGATMWFPRTEITQIYVRSWSDFECINDGKASVPSSIYLANAVTMEALDKLGEVDVIVTHHLPSFESVHPAFARSKTNDFFVNPVSEKILSKTKTWIHGHTHWGNSYVAGNGTKIVCNPYGYDNAIEKAEGFCNFKPLLDINI